MTPDNRGYLKALEVCHYVWGGLSCLLGLIPIIHIVLGWMILHGSWPDGGLVEPDAPFSVQFMGKLFFWGGIAAVVLAQTMGILNIVSGRFMAKRRHRLFSMIIAGVNCLSIPLGTVLGVFTFVLLSNEDVRRDYA